MENIKITVELTDLVLVSAMVLSASILRVDN